MVDVYCMVKVWKWNNLLSYQRFKFHEHDNKLYFHPWIVSIWPLIPCPLVHNAYFVQYIFPRNRISSDLDLKIWVLVTRWTYICPSLIECAKNTFFHFFFYFQSLDLWFPPKYAPVSTPSFLNMPLYPPLLFIVSDTGSQKIQEHRIEQSTHCAVRLTF